MTAFAPRIRLGLCVCLLAPFARVEAQDITATPSARDWSMALFSKEGYRTMTLSGSSVRPVDANQIEIVGMNFVLYEGGAAPRVDAVLLSPAATFFLKEKIARGRKSVRLTRDDVDMVGEDWIYYADQKKVSIARHTRVVFHTPLPDILQ